MANIYSKKSRKIFVSILAIILAVSMVVPFLLYLI